METNDKRIRVLIADDHPAIREGLTRFILGQKDIELVGQAVNGKEALDLAQKLNPNVLVLDIDMPEMDGLEVARRLMSIGCVTAILIFSAYADTIFTETVLVEGVKGYIAKEEGPAQLLQAVRKISKLHSTGLEGKPLA